MFSIKKRLITSIVSIVLVLASVLGLSGCVGCIGGPDAPIKNSIKAMETGEAKYMLKAFPKDMQKAIKDDDDAMEGFESMIKSQKEAMETVYGEGFKISYKVKDKEKIDKDDLKDVQDMLDEISEDEDIGKMKVSKGYEMKVEMKYKGDKKEETETETIEVYKVDGKWCILGY